MTPTLNGRIQTRVFVLLTLGVAWTALISFALPDRPSITDTYQITFRALAAVLIAGVGWEFIYHGLQQFRWERDWPTPFGFLTGINEGIVAWFVLQVLLGSRDVTVAQYVIHFSTTWMVVFLFLNGPMRVLSLHWRFRGGRLV